MNDLWPHQRKGIDDTLAAIAAGQRRILVTSPTGGGKSRIAQELAAHYLERGQKVVLYSNRRLLTEQLSRVLQEAGFAHGVRAAGHVGDHEQPLQVASIPTEHSRVTKRKLMERHRADLVLIDEAHSQTAEMASKLMDAHREEDSAVIVGFTATPIGLAGLYDHLVVAGTNSELRTCGALVEARHYGCDEPDLRRMKLVPGKDLSEEQQIAAMRRPGLFGRVWKHYERLNPERKPTILFAPGVRQSLWFAEQFWAKGVSAAHIDGEEVWINGERQPTSREARQEALDGSRDGRISVLCNRYVLREGIDAPWLAHAILACIFGALQSYLQSGGRLLRSDGQLEAVVVQDHGGNWHRHGSLNADREWRLDWSSTTYAGIRADRLRGKRCRTCQEPLKGPMCWKCGTLNEWEPTLCPQCQRVITGRKCSCGWIAPAGWKKSRPVITTNGELRLMHGDIYVPRRITSRMDGPVLWERMYWRATSDRWNASFAQAEAMFAQENNWEWPDPTWPLMPRDPVDRYRKVKLVDMKDLIPKVQA